jgi:putative MATE family efflux protein
VEPTSATLPLEPTRADPPPTFTVGSIMRHVLVMSSTGAIGLMAIFAVDLLSLLYISWLGDVNLTAAVGFAATVLFFPISINVGLMIGVSATVSRAIGERDRERARRLAGSTLAITTIAAALVGLLAMLSADGLLRLLGASGEAQAVAHRFLMITLPANALMGLGMGLSGLLRAVGDAKRSMYVTLAGGIATAIVDPLLIFGLGLGVDGAAVATVLSRVVFCIVGFHGALSVHRMIARPRAASVIEDIAPMLSIAVPAILTNVATPVANGFMTAVMAPFGDEAVAANAIMARLAPVAFGILFALAGAVGPIFGQNLGARLFDRVRRTLTDGLIVSLVTTLAAWAVLALGQDLIVQLFAAAGETATLVKFFCTVIAGSWIFHGALFVANAGFNNLGAPFLATAFNWGKATLGTIPVAMLGARLGGPEGALIGQAIGAVGFGLGSVVCAYGVIRQLKRRSQRAPASGQTVIAGAGPGP